MTRSLTIAVAAAAALIALTACSNSGNNQADQSPVSTSTSIAQAHNQADIMFTQHMIPHHQQAIEMSDIVLGKQGIDPRVMDLANKIKAAQGPEIEQMQSWLTQWGMPMMPGMSGMPGQSQMPSQSGMPHHSTEPSASMTPGQNPMPSQSMMPSGSMMPGMEGMAGMMSQEDMEALQNAQGVEASKLFLQQMIQHHQGAINMAQDEINTGQYPPAVALGRSIVTSQQQEINTMQAILASL